MSDEEFCVGCFCQNLAETYHNDKQTRNLMVKAFRVSYRTDGTILFDENVVSTFASKLASRHQNDLDWSQIEEQDRLDAANEILFRFLTLVMDDAGYLAKFSTN